MTVSFYYARNHAYARRNGYKGTYDEYVALQYDGYKATCKRCDIKPMNRQQWNDSHQNR